MPERFATALTAALEVDAPLTHDDVAVIIATSGSNGEPRGVELSAAALQATAKLTQEALGPPGNWLTALPVTGIGGLMTVIRALIHRTEIVAWSGVGGAASFTPASFAAAATQVLTTAGVDGMPAYVSLVPTQLARIVDDPVTTELLAGFGAVVSGGGATPERISERLRAAGVNLVTTYGLTETCGGVVYDGRPLPGVDVAVDDKGIISIAGPTLASGYRFRPDLDKKRFRDGWFCTNDFGAWSDGRLEVFGRIDDVVKVGGSKVSLTGITNALLRHPRVITALTRAEQDEEWGSVPVSYVVPDSISVLEQPAPLEQLQSELSQLVADSQGRASVPRRFEFRAELPQTASGKPTI